jgi:secreted trypsin-like serine protease
VSTHPFAPVLAGLAVLLTGCAPDRAAGPSALPTTPNAIVYGSPDVANTYSNVGAFIVQAPNGRVFPICSGTLVAPTVFLTAAHCTSVFESVLVPLGYTARVSFRNLIAFDAKTDAATTASLIAVTGVITNPAYSQRQSDVGDLALLTLASAPAGIAPATLPALGLLDQLSEKNGLGGSTFTVAGYGVQDRVVGGGTPFFTDANPVYRGYAVESFLALNGGFLRLSQNPARGDSGACYGDSGGPNFLSVSGQQLLVAVTITGDEVCRATNVAYRLDTPSARGFLDQYLP